MGMFSCFIQASGPVTFSATGITSPVLSPPALLSSELARSAEPVSSRKSSFA
jgi:hypothetical protein